MPDHQTMEVIEVESLPQRVQELRKQHYRLVQIGATRLPERVELTYSFDLASHLVSLRLHLPATRARVPSIGGIYWGAFSYENEIQDLFEVQVDGMLVDFHGKLYQTAVKFPFGASKSPLAETKPANVRNQSSKPSAQLSKELEQQAAPAAAQ